VIYEDMQESETQSPRTPHARQIEIVSESIRALERIGHTYAANQQRALLDAVERATERD
jgi:hypothetical protein